MLRRWVTMKSGAMIALAATGWLLTTPETVKALDTRSGLGTVATQHGTVKLILAERDGKSADITAGVQIKLKPGWKTYWRTPGDSGIPPSFDWSRSRNLEKAEIKWPVPQRFTEHGETIYGYRDEVVFPVSVWPKNSDEPVKLSLSLFYAVCREICVPVQADVQVETDAAGRDNEGIDSLRRFEAMVPQAQVDGLDIAGLALDDSTAEPALKVTLKTIDADTPIEIFVESERSGAGFGAPEQVATKQDLREFRIPIEAGALARGKAVGALTITAVQGKKALARKLQVE